MKITISGEQCSRLLAPLAAFTKTSDSEPAIHLCIDSSVPDLPRVHFMMTTGVTAGFTAHCCYEAPAGTVSVDADAPAITCVSFPACYLLKGARAAGRRTLTLDISHYITISISKHIPRADGDAPADDLIVVATVPATASATSSAAEVPAVELICSCSHADGAHTFSVPSLDAADYDRASVWTVVPMLLGRALAFSALPLWLMRRSPASHYGVEVELSCQGFRLWSESSRLGVDFHAGEDSFERKYRDSALRFLLPTSAAKVLADVLTREGDAARMLYDHRTDRLVVACGCYVFTCPVLPVSQPAEAEVEAAASVAESAAEATISPSVTLDRAELLDACQRFNVFADKALDLIIAPSGTLLVSSSGGECRLEGHPLGFDTAADAADADDYVASYRVCAKSIVAVLKLMEAKRVIVSLLPDGEHLQLKGLETDHELTATLAGA